MEENKPKKVAIYSRKSKFTGKGESIENQIELCKQYIRTHFPEATVDNITVYEDEGFSGGNTERPQFKRMMASAEAGKLSAIVCYRLDRISRNIGDFAKLIERLEASGVAFISIKEQFDTSSPMGRAMMYISSVFSQLERETIAERIRDNMHELSKTGRWLGGTTPTGYASESMENLTVDGKIKKSCKLKIIPEEAELIRNIFAKFLDTNSLAGTEAFLMQRGCTTKRGNYFSRFALKNILTNPVYMTADRDAYEYLVENEADLFADEACFDGKHGVMAYNRTAQRSGRAHQIRPMNEWIVSVGKHVGIVNGADWVRAQENLEQNRSKTYRKPRSNAALLSGLLVCGNCGGYMRPKLSSRVNRQGEYVFSYLCSLKERSRRHTCDVLNAGGNALDRAVWGIIANLRVDDKELIKRLEGGLRSIVSDCEECGSDIDRLLKSVAENEKEIEALVNTLTKVSGSAAEDYIVREIDRIHEKNVRLKSRITELEANDSVHAFSDIEFGIVLRTLSTFNNILDGMDVEQKRSALRILIKKIVWDGENANIYLFGSSENGANM